MGANPIPYSEIVKYLGVYIDSKLTWKQHLKNKIRSAKGHMLKLRNAMGKLWGFPPRMCRWAYTGIVRPAFTYGSLVWSGACDNKWVKKDLSRLNRLALLMMGHFRKGTPTAGLEVIAQIIPLDLHLKSEALLAHTRTSWVEKDGLCDARKGGHRQKNNESLRLANLGSLLRLDCTTSIHFWDKSYSINTDSFRAGTLTEVSPDAVVIYTDGSRTQEEVGSGIVIYKAGGKIQIMEEALHLANYNTVFQAEVVAIKSAAEWLLENPNDSAEIHLYSDSQAALKALLSCTMSSKLVISTAQALDLLGRTKQVKLHWVKAHVGLPGNERADTLAKRGALNPDSVKVNPPAKPRSLLRKTIQNLIDEEWSKIWTNRKDCRQTKLWFPTINKNLSSQLFRLNRQQFSKYVQLITGHNFLKRHSFLLGESQDKECRLCLEDEETSSHIIADCPALARIRFGIFGAPFVTFPLQWSLVQIATFLQEGNIGSLLDPRGTEN